MGFMTKVTMHWDAEWIDFLVSGTRQIDVHVKNKNKNENKTPPPPTKNFTPTS